MKKLTAEEIAAEMDKFESIYPIPGDTSRCGRGYAVHDFNAWDGHAYSRKWEGWIARAEFEQQESEGATNE